MLVAVGIAAAVTIGGCVACAGLFALTAEQEDRAQRRNTIPDAQGRAARLGTPERALRARFGPPARPYRSDREEAGDPCLFWNVRGAEVGTQWQFCFTSGRLAAKYRWAR